MSVRSLTAAVMAVRASCQNMKTSKLPMSLDAVLYIECKGCPKFVINRTVVTPGGIISSDVCLQYYSNCRSWGCSVGITTGY
jgi:hypothetical protein